MGGGSVISLLGVWRAHGLDEVLREAWEAGVVLCGVSAGSLCWFAEGVTAFTARRSRFGASACSAGATPSTTRASAAATDAFRAELLSGDAPGYAAERRLGAPLRRRGSCARSSSRPDARAFRMRRARARDKSALRVAYLGRPPRRPRLAAPAARLAAVA